jgi:peptidoglycan/LPS O-acetylase OafA/YrhL
MSEAPFPLPAVRQTKMVDSTRRIPQLDGIRGAAILLVAIWHFVVAPVMRTPHESVIARIVIHAGLLTWSGVDLFFVLSGFLIGGILIDAKDSHNYFKAFYIRRAFRILPVYLLVVIVYLLYWSMATTQKTVLRAIFGGPMPWYVYFTFTQNFWLARYNWDSVFLTVSWSLAVEEQFYLLLPAIVRLLRRQLVLPAAVALALGSASTRILLYLHYGPSWSTAAYTLLFSRADALMLGVICAAVLRDRKLKELLVRNLWAVKTSSLLFGLVVGVFIYRGWGIGTMPMCTLGFTCVASFYASVLMIAIIAPEGILSRAFRARWLMRFGTIAYGLYLFHLIVLTAAFHILVHHPPSIGNWRDAVTAFCAFVGAVGLAQLSWRCFESKLVRLGHRFAYEGGTATRSPEPLSVSPVE